MLQTENERGERLQEELRNIFEIIVGLEKLPLEEASLPKLAPANLT